MRRRAWIGWTAALLWMALIFLGSTDVLSAGHTSRFIEPFLRWISGDRLNAAQIEQVHFFIRKLGHLTEYAVLAVLLWNAMIGLRPPESLLAGPRRHRTTLGAAFLLASLYAAGDEFHQSFVPTRGASVHDVLIDVAGACGGLLLLQGYCSLRRPPVGGRRHPDRF